MPPLDNSPMSWARYLSVLDPFEILVTLIMLAAIVNTAGLVADLFIRNRMKEKP
jgi:hypothetical protein